LICDAAATQLLNICAVRRAAIRNIQTLPAVNIDNLAPSAQLARQVPPLVVSQIDDIPPDFEHYHPLLLVFHCLLKEVMFSLQNTAIGRSPIAVSISPPGNLKDRGSPTSPGLRQPSSLRDFACEPIFFSGA
jgi:hypothetical protein